MVTYKRIGIIAAMAEERAAIFKYLTDTKVILEKAGLVFEEGRYGDLEVVVVCAGIGKVNAAMCTQILIDYCKPEVLLNVGVAGALDPVLKVGDVVISTDAQHHDMDCSAVGDPVGIVPRMKNSIFKADPELIELAKQIGEGMDLNVYCGKVVSGDQFIGSKEKKEYLYTTFNGMCAEMEGAAMAHVCELNDLPYLVIRSISDQADGEADITYEEFKDIAAERAGVLLQGMLEAIK